MNPELSKALADLASKMGTTADRVFPMLVAKERLEAYLGFFGFGALFLLCLGAIWICRKKLDHWDEGAVIGGLIAGVLSLMFVCLCVANIGGMVFPEASAIQSLVPKP